MKRLENAILTLTRLSATDYSGVACGGIRIDARILLAITLVFLISLLSMPLTAPVRLLWMAIYPIIASNLLGLSYGRIFVRSLWILPLVGLFVAFNPVFDRQPILIDGITVSRGWVTAVSIIVRGLLAFQALLILIEREGFNGMCETMRRLHVPAILTTQLQMVYRYLTVLLVEALTMFRARRARGFGRKNMPVSEWGVFVGQLFIRTVARSERIHRAMLARGFTGTMPGLFRQNETRPGKPDYLWLAGWTMAILLLRFVDFPSLFHLI